MGNKYELPYLSELFHLLQTGKHLCHDDGDKYWALEGDKDKYTDCFAALGYELIEHTKGFFYFQQEGKANTENTKKMALFIFLLIEYLDKRENDLEEALMATRFSFDNLPHLKSERYRELMDEVNITDQAGLAAVGNTMQAYGFATIFGKQGFEFKTPVYRFFDLCAASADFPKAEMEVLDDRD
jgi:hypothetical protein